MRSRLNRSGEALRRLRKALVRRFSSRRFVRYTLLACNVLLLIAVSFFVVRSSSSQGFGDVSSLSSGAETATDPLDQLSSADIAVNLARMTDLYETTAVVNQADSVSAELAVTPAENVVAGKPQAVATALKSNKDIKEYTVQSGDTVASIAAKFNVTSDSILWSNNLSSGASVNPGTKLLIPPVNGIVYTVKEGDTPENLAQKYKANKDQIIAYNDAELSGLKVGERIIIPGGQQPAPVVTRRASTGFAWGGGAVYGYNGYDYGFCTWYVANRRTAIGRPVPANLGDAWTWDDRAAAAGLSVNRTPAVGAVVVTNSTRRPGHVAFVERVNADGSIWISEMNSRGQRGIDDPRPAGGWGQVDYKLIGADQARSYNYIH